MDGLTLTASALELRSLIGGKIEKIQQPDKFELLFSVHINGASSKFIASSSSENCRIHITNEKRLSPVDAPNFLMLVRKHLGGARIVSVDQPNHDRIVIIGFEGRTELNDRAEFKLVCEIMGRHSNIILVDSDGNIIDAIRRVSPSMSSVRLVLPHIPYTLPPVQDKIDPEKLTAEKLDGILLNADLPDKALSNAVCGLSPAVAGIMLENIDNGGESLSKSIIRFYNDIFERRLSPSIALRGEKRILLPFTPAGENCISFNSLSDAADEFYRSRAERESAKRRAASLEKVVQNTIQRLERKADKFSLSIGEEAEIEQYRLYGELLTANIYMLPERAAEVSVDNYYLNPPMKTVIPLDETKNCAENAQLYYKRYRKAKSARDIALVMLRETLDEIEYLCGVEVALDNCSVDADFDEVREELASFGYIRESRNKGARKQQKPQKAKPYSYTSSDGFTILVGKNNTQNDRLTFKDAAPDDIWLHTKDVHGSHVILKLDGRTATDTALFEAAVLAAYHSQGRTSGNTAVDYTQRKYVKKPSGAKPGFVIYTHQKTLIVAPDAALAEKLSRK